eukprot:Rmarinus@m.12193
MNLNKLKEAVASGAQRAAGKLDTLLQASSQDDASSSRNISAMSHEQLVEIVQRQRDKLKELRVVCKNLAGERDSVKSILDTCVVTTEGGKSLDVESLRTAVTEEKQTNAALRNKLADLEKAHSLSTQDDPRRATAAANDLEQERDSWKQRYHELVTAFARLEETAKQNEDVLRKQKSELERFHVASSAESPEARVLQLQKELHDSHARVDEIKSKAKEYVSKKVTELNEWKHRAELAEQKLISHTTTPHPTPPASDTHTPTNSVALNSATSGLGEVGAEDSSSQPLSIAFESSRAQLADLLQRVSAATSTPDTPGSPLSNITPDTDDGLSSLTTHLSREVEVLLSRAKSSSVEFNNLQKRYEELENRCRDNEARLQASLPEASHRDEVDRELAATAARASKLETLFQEATDKLQSVTERATAGDRRIQELEEALQANSSELQSAVASGEAARKALSEAQEKVREFQARAERAETEAVRLSEGAAENTKHLEHVASTMTEKEEELIELAKKHEQLQEELQTAGARIADLQAAIQQKDSEVDAAREQASSAGKKAGMLEAKLLEHQGSLSEREREIGDLRKQVESGEDKLQHALARISELEGLVKANETEVGLLRSQVEGGQGDLSKSKTREDELRAALKGAEGRCSSLEETLEQERLRATRLDETVEEERRVRCG